MEIEAAAAGATRFRRVVTAHMSCRGEASPWISRTEFHALTPGPNFPEVLTPIQENKIIRFIINTIEEMYTRKPDVIPTPGCILYLICI